MPEYKVVNSEQLDNGLRSVADSIRAKSGKYETMTFPEGFVSAIEEIENTSDIGKPYINTSEMTSFAYFFDNGGNLHLLDKIDTSNAWNFEGLFRYYYAETVPLVDTSNGTNFSYMFSGCQVLKEIPPFNFNNGWVFSWIFSYCHSLETAPMIDTGNAQSLNSMFESCSALITVPLYDTKNCENFMSMFSNCTLLEEVPQFDMRNAFSFNSMFWNCLSLKTVPPIVSDEENVDIGYMFYGCTSLKEVPLLKMGSVTNYWGVFQDCTSLETVNLDFGKNTYEDIQAEFFYNCTALKNITINEGWSYSLYLYYSPELTVESLHGMIENLEDNSEQSSYRVFNVGEVNLAKIDEAHIQMLNDKNWTYY